MSDTPRFSWEPVAPHRPGVRGPLYWNPKRPPHGVSPWGLPGYRPVLATYRHRPRHGAFKGRYLDTLRKRAWERFQDSIRAIGLRARAESEGE